MHTNQKNQGNLNKISRSHTFQFPGCDNARWGKLCKVYAESLHYFLQEYVILWLSQKKSLIESMYTARQLNI